MFKFSRFKSTNQVCYAEKVYTQFRKNRIHLVLGLIPLLLLCLAVFIGAWQIPAVRQFFGQASGENANIFVDTKAVLGPMRRPWRNLAQGGEGFSWRLRPLIPQVKELHPEYIRLDHIYDFYDIVKGTPGNITFDFTKFDKVIDDILAVGAKPYIALSYMPPAISSGDILATPVRWSDWQLVVQKTVEHVSGTKHISDVYYEVWNEPDLFGGWKYYGNKNYLTLYNYAAQGASAARGVQPFKIGGPAITALYKEWFSALMKNTIATGVRMDFFSWHRYNLNLDQFKTDMFNAKSWLAEFPQLEPSMELHITEWGHDSNNNGGYDTNYGAAHTVAGAIEMVNVVDRAFAFEIQDGKDPKGQKYWGRWGLFTDETSGATAKPRYAALRMLDRISTQRLQTLGKGTWVKALAALTPTGSTQVVLANFDSHSGHAEVVPITFQNIDPGEYTVKKEFLGGQFQVDTVATTEATLRVQVPMTPNSVSFIELTQTTSASIPTPSPVMISVPDVQQANDQPLTPPGQ